MKFIYLMLVSILFSSSCKKEKIPFEEERMQMAENVSGDWKLTELYFENHNYAWGSVYESTYENIQFDTLKRIKIQYNFSLNTDTILEAHKLAKQDLNISHDGNLKLTSKLTTHTKNFSASNYTSASTTTYSDWKKEMNETNMFFNMDYILSGKFCSELNGNTLKLSFYTSSSENYFSQSNSSLVMYFERI